MWNLAVHVLSPGFPALDIHELSFKVKCFPSLKFFPRDIPVVSGAEVGKSAIVVARTSKPQYRNLQNLKLGRLEHFEILSAQQEIETNSPVNRPSVLLWPL